VDLPQDVAFAVLAQLVKLHAEPAARLLAHAEPAQPVVHCPQWSTMQAGEVRVDASLCTQRENAPAAPYPQRAAQADFAVVEFITPTPDRFEAIADLAVFRRGQPQTLWQLLERQAGRYLVEHFQYQRLVKVVLYSQTHIAPAAQRQVAGE